MLLKHPAGQHRRALPRAQGKHGDHRDDVCKPQLHPRDGHHRGKLRLQEKNGQRDGRQQPQQGNSLRLHGVSPQSAINSSSEMIFVPNFAAFWFLLLPESLSFVIR